MISTLYSQLGTFYPTLVGKTEYEQLNDLNETKTRILAIISADVGLSANSGICSKLFDFVKKIRKFATGFLEIFDK